MPKDDITGILIIGGIAAAGYFLYKNGNLQQWFPSLFGTSAAAQGSSQTTTTGSTGTTGSTSQQSTSAPGTTQQQSSSVPVLTVADAATLPYSSAITSDMINAVHDQLVTNFDAGQIPVIGGGSVLAFMLGWGGQASSATETVAGETYIFDGTNWNLQTQVKTIDACAGIPTGNFSAAISQGVWNATMAAFANALKIPQACQDQMQAQARDFANVKAATGMGNATRIPVGFIHNRGLSYRFRRPI